MMVEDDSPSSSDADGDRAIEMNDDLLHELSAELTSAGMEVSARVERHRRGLYVDFPSGRQSRRRFIHVRSLADLADFSLSELALLESYEALFYRPDRLIEAALTRDLMPFRGVNWLPGAEVINAAGEFEAFSPDAERPACRSDAWRLLVSGAEFDIEISPASLLFAHVLGTGRVRRPTTIKLRGVEARGHDEALRILEDYSRSFLFDIDVRYGATIKLRETRRRLVFDTGTPRVTTPPEFPRNRYPKEPTELYMYGRSARNLPLLEYLAYYQAVEYFFPVFARARAVRRMRTMLRDPRFDVGDDVQISRLIDQIAEGNLGMSERQQLRETMRACVDAAQLESVVTSTDEMNKHFTKNRQAIRGVQRLNLSDKQSDLRDQVSDRIYAIRCRIAHTKSDASSDELATLQSALTDAEPMWSSRWASRGRTRCMGWGIRANRDTLRRLLATINVVDEGDGDGVMRPMSHMSASVRRRWEEY